VVSKHVKYMEAANLPLTLGVFFVLCPIAISFWAVLPELAEKDLFLFRVFLSHQKLGTMLHNAARLTISQALSFPWNNCGYGLRNTDIKALACKVNLFKRSEVGKKVLSGRVEAGVTK